MLKPRHVNVRPYKRNFAGGTRLRILRCEIARDCPLGPVNHEGPQAGRREVGRSESERDLKMLPSWLGGWGRGPRVDSLAKLHRRGSRFSPGGSSGSVALPTL